MFHFCNVSVNGGWGVWSSWTECDKDCNTGLRERRRDCNNPTPGDFGNPCDGDTLDTESCNSQECTGKFLNLLANFCTPPFIMAGHYVITISGGREGSIHKFDHLYLGHHVTNPYGPSYMYMYVVWTKFCVSCVLVPSPQCIPKVSN